MAGDKARMRDTLNAFGLEVVPLGIAYAAPYVPPAPPVSAWRGIGLSWTGWNGNEWELIRLQVCSCGRVSAGFGVPILERQSTSSPMVPGSRHRDTSTPDCEVFWSLCLYADVSSAAYREHDRAFWRSLDADYEGTWTAALPGRQTHLEAPPLRATIGGQSTS
jgi:hypothetical protein